MSNSQEWFKGTFALLCILDIRTHLGVYCLMSDMWSDLNQWSFMAVIAHWMAKGGSKQLELCSGLIVFWEVDENHSGNNLGQGLFNIIQDIRIAHTVCIYHTFTQEKHTGPIYRLVRLHLIMHWTIIQWWGNSRPYSIAWTNQSNFIMLEITSGMSTFDTGI